VRLREQGNIDIGRIRKSRIFVLRTFASLAFFNMADRFRPCHWKPEFKRRLQYKHTYNCATWQIISQRFSVNKAETGRITIDHSM